MIGRGDSNMSFHDMASKKTATNTSEDNAFWNLLVGGQIAFMPFIL